MPESPQETTTITLETPDGPVMAQVTLIRDERGRVDIETRARGVNSTEWRVVGPRVRVYDPRPAGGGIHRLFPSGWETLQLVKAAKPNSREPRPDHVALTHPTDTEDGCHYDHGGQRFRRTTLCGLAVVSARELHETDTVSMIDCSRCREIMEARSR